MAMPSDEVLEEQLRDALRSQNLETLSLKNLRAQLELKFQVDLSEKKHFLKDAVTRLLSEGQQDKAGEDEQEDGDEDNDENNEEEPPSKLAKQRKKSGPTAAGGSGMRGKYQLSAELDNFLGHGDAFMSRGGVTKELWRYIKANKLQDPKDGRRIRNDERMEKIFKCKTMNMFHISKKLSSHMKKYSDLVDDGGADDDDNNNDDDDDDDERPSAPKKAKVGKAGSGKAAPAAKPKKSQKKPSSTASSKKSVKQKGGAGKGGKGGGKAGEEEKEKKPRQPSTIKWKVSPQLAAVVGSDEATFDAIRASVNEYIKNHNLQDPQNKRTVHCDATLERIMGKSTVDMFGMQNLYSTHRLHKIT